MMVGYTIPFKINKMKWKILQIITIQCSAAHHIAERVCHFLKTQNVLDCPSVLLRVHALCITFHPTNNLIVIDINLMCFTIIVNSLQRIYSNQNSIEKENKNTLESEWINDVLALIFQNGSSKKYLLKTSCFVFAVK